MTLLLHFNEKTSSNISPVQLFKTLYHICIGPARRRTFKFPMYQITIFHSSCPAQCRYKVVIRGSIRHNFPFQGKMEQLFHLINHALSTQNISKPSKGPCIWNKTVIDRALEHTECFFGVSVPTQSKYQVLISHMIWGQHKL
ncbi:hypothetical protein AAHE18_17G052200 [Arachis hypogaea]